jgi:tRNA (cytidine/uridine-2'-O-)-methyltransferase
MSQEAPLKDPAEEGSRLRLAFYQPDIPQNLGATVRLAACFGVSVDVIEPCGFPLTDKSLKRASLDYGKQVDLVRHDGWSAFLAATKRESGRLVLFTTRGASPLQEFRFDAGDTLLFGRESAGVPEEVHAAAGARVVIPLVLGARSLNVAMTAGIALWEALKQTGRLPATND